eukprot:1161814-Pelagomonas_calceolata.AAC.10
MKEKRKFVVVLVQKSTHHEILPVGTREHISCGERPPGDVCHERGRVVHPGRHHRPHKGHSTGTRNLGKTCDSKLLSHSEGCEIHAVNTESKSSHAANDIMGEVKEHVFGETGSKNEQKRELHGGRSWRKSIPQIFWLAEEEKNSVCHGLIHSSCTNSQSPTVSHLPS